jgi:hypothetical protein
MICQIAQTDYAPFTFFSAHQSNLCSHIVNIIIETDPPMQDIFVEFNQKRAIFLPIALKLKAEKLVAIFNMTSTN